jgi:mediator of RNA polymerase II transcription subunit 7
MGMFFVQSVRVLKMVKQQWKQSLLRFGVTVVFLWGRSSSKVCDGRLVRPKLGAAARLRPYVARDPLFFIRRLLRKTHSWLLSLLSTSSTFTMSNTAATAPNSDPASASEPAGDAAAAAAPGEATLLVSEFPPPPFYYPSSASLRPPPIPKEALQRGTRKAAAAAAKARAEAERQRLTTTTGESMMDPTGQVLGGVAAGTEDEEEEGEVVGVFGEIVEDPCMVEPLDHCEDPTVIREEVKRLNRKVVQGFVHLVQDLVNRPADNKKQRDELSHNVFLMVQEANKFREHQSREILIEVLQQQLERRLQLTKELEGRIAQADKLLCTDAAMEES